MNKELKNIVYLKDKQMIEKQAKIIKETKTYHYQNFVQKYYPVLCKKIKDFGKQTYEAFERDIENVCKGAHDRALVSCFSLAFNHPLMWANYADKHKGACIEYEVDDNFADDVKYRNIPPVIELKRAVEIILGHDFSKEEIDIENREYKFILSPLMTKSKEWKYEKEKRCVLSDKNDVKKFIKDKGGRTLLPMSGIKAIYFGCKASDAFIETMRNKCKKIIMYRMELARNSYKLVAKKI